MEIIFQYAITDTRRFIDKYSEYLSTFKIFDKDEYPDVFIKSIGKHYTKRCSNPKKPSKFTRKCPKNIEKYYPGATKDFFCAFDAKKTFKINNWFSFWKQKENEDIDIYLRSRKFYFERNDFVSGIYEICFYVSPRREMNLNMLDKLVEELLSLTFRIPQVSTIEKSTETHSDQKDNSKTFRNADEVLNKHYAFATSPHKKSSDIEDSLQFIKCSKPRIFINTNSLCDNDKNILLPLFKKNNFRYYEDRYGANIDAFWLHNVKNENITNQYKQINEIPIIAKSLQIVLGNIKNRQISPVEKGRASDKLQDFLKNAIDILGKNKSHDFEFLSEYDKNLFLKQSEIDLLLKNLKSEINVRRYVFNQVCDYIEEESKILEDKIKRKKSIFVAIILFIVIIGFKLLTSEEITLSVIGLLLLPAVAFFSIGIGLIPLKYLESLPFLKNKN